MSPAYVPKPGNLSRLFFLRLYLFAVVIMATSTLISSIVMGTIFQRDRARMLPPQEAMEQVRAQMVLVRELLPAEPLKRETLLKKIALVNHWDLSLWQDGRLVRNYIGPAPDPALAARLIAGDGGRKRWTAVPLDGPQGRQWLMIHPKPPGRGGPPPRPLAMVITPFLLTLLTLMILLLPFVRRIVRPFNHLLASIRRVSVGNYETRLALPPRSEFAALADEFNHMTGQIQKTLAEKQRLIADVSHELRSPLARLRVSLELMAKRGSVPEKYYTKAVSEVEQLDALIDDLLDASRLELRAGFSPQRTEMRQYLRELIDKNQLLFAAHPLELRFHHPDQPVWCELDRELIERTFNNIISNTLKHAKPPAVLDLSLSADAGGVELLFRDNGPGVAAEDCLKIFDPFYRSDDSRTRSTGGVGLGLSIVRKIVQLHRGEVWASSGDGRPGLLIGLRLPARMISVHQTQTLN